MNWVKNNASVLIFLGVVLLFIGTGINTIMKSDAGEEITVVSGDTLWSLAKEHKGEMDTQEWIYEVVQSNAIIDNQIFAGKTLVVPNTVNKPNQIEIASDQ